MVEDAKAPRGGESEERSWKDKDYAFPKEMGITMDKRIDFAIAVVSLLLGVFILIAARDIRPGTQPDPITSRGMPNIIGTFITICGIILMVMQLRTWSVLPGHFVVEEGKVDDEGYPASWIRAMTIAAATFLWLWLLKPLGYLFVTPVFMAIGSLALGERSWIKVIGLAVVYTVVTWYVFSQPLAVILPNGPLSHVFRSWGLTP